MQEIIDEDLAAEPRKERILYSYGNTQYPTRHKNEKLPELR